jgi:EPS-associated MarR family transcriptional regulator
MTSRNSRTQEDTDFRVMHLLEENPDITQRELAERLGVSVGRLNYCLKALMNRGWVKMQNFTSSKNKFGYMYLLTPDGVIQKTLFTGKFLKRKLLEYEALRAEIQGLGGYDLIKNSEIDNKKKITGILNTES